MAASRPGFLLTGKLGTCTPNTAALTGLAVLPSARNVRAARLANAAADQLSALQQMTSAGARPSRPEMKCLSRSPGDAARQRGRARDGHRIFQ
jgi:hypothetical protein